MSENLATTVLVPKPKTLSSKLRKVECGVLHFAGPRGVSVDVRPANGVKFTLEEWQAAVGGYVEMMTPAIRGRKVFVNEEGILKGLLDNRRTWTFANRDTYVVFNGYAPNWKVAGNALETYKVFVEDALPTAKTIKEALRLAGQEAAR